MGKNLLPLLAIVLFVLLATFPLLVEGFPPTHDGEYHVIRFYEFFKTISSGVIYPRWAEDLNNGYGVPLFNYVYPLPNYIASFFHLVGFSFIESFKSSLILATGVGAVGFYFFSKYFTSKLAGTVGAILYVFTPYRFVDTYVRGSVGEVWSLAIFPLLLWSLAILIREGKYTYIGISATLLALFIFSHNILAVLLFPFLFTYVIFLILQTKKKKRPIYLAGGSLLLGIGMSAIFWLPALVEKKYSRGLEVYDYKTSFPDLSSLLFPSWGTGFAGDIADGMSTQIGVVNLLIVILCVAFAYVFLKKRNDFFFFTLVWFFLTVILMLPLSKIVWETIPLFRFVQFPWRYLSLTIVICSLLGSLLISVSRFRMIAATGLVGLALLTTIGYTRPAYYHNRDDSHYISRSNFIHSTNSPGNAFNTIWIEGLHPKKNKRIEVFSGSAHIIMSSITPERYMFRVNASTPTRILVNTAFFPGWEAQLLGKSITPQITKQGLMIFSLPKGEYLVTIAFTDTMIRRAGALFSFISLAVTAVFSGFFLFHSTKKR